MDWSPTRLRVVIEIQMMGFRVNFILYFCGFKIFESTRVCMSDSGIFKCPHRRFQKQKCHVDLHHVKEGFEKGPPRAAQEAERDDESIKGQVTNVFRDGRRMGV